jgi:hypothetical protein
MPETPIPDASAKKDYSITMEQANFYAIPILLVSAVLLLVPFWVIWGGGAIKEGFSDFFSWSLLPVLVIGIILHEAIHGITWMLAGRKPARAIKYGFQVKTFTPYAHCKEPLPARAYKTGAAMPGILLGLAPALAGMITGNGWLLFLGVFFTVSAAGDAIILWLLRNVPATALVEDHPTNAGCYVYSE